MGAAAVLEKTNEDVPALAFHFHVVRIRAACHAELGTESPRAPAANSACDDHAGAGGCNSERAAADSPAAGSEWPAGSVPEACATTRAPQYPDGGDCRLAGDGARGRSGDAGGIYGLSVSVLPPLSHGHFRGAEEAVH